MNAPTPIVPAKILVVDDDALVAMGIVTVLEYLGHSVVEANSGRQALALVESDTTIDLVITDQSMPGMSGTELAQAVVQIRPNLPIVLATGYRDVPEGAELNLFRIQKPYDDDAVAKTVADALSHRRA